MSKKQKFFTERQKYIAGIRTEMSKMSDEGLKDMFQRMKMGEYK